MKLYLVGPTLNHKGFLDAAAQLRVIGYEVETRASDVHVSSCQGVALIDGWKDWEWAANKVELAKTLDIPSKPVRDWIFDADMENRSLTVETGEG